MAASGSDDLRERPIVVETDERLPAGDNAHQLAVGVEGVWKLRFVVAACGSRLGEVIDHHIGTACQQFIGIAGALHTDDDREAAVTARLHTRLGVFDQDGPARIRGESARYVEEHGEFGPAVAREPPGEPSVDMDGEQILDVRGAQHAMPV